MPDACARGQPRPSGLLETRVAPGSPHATLTNFALAFLEDTCAFEGHYRLARWRC
jgi:hypothetical protein